MLLKSPVLYNRPRKGNGRVMGIGDDLPVCNEGESFNRDHLEGLAFSLIIADFPERQRC
jgi:hypothetical protein